MKRVLLSGLLLGSLLLCGCGYHPQASGVRWAGEGGRSLYVELFANRTAEPYLDTVLTDEVTRQLSRSRLVALASQRGNAELLLTGTIDAFTSAAQAYTSSDRVSEYRVHMAATVRLLRRSDGALLWQGTLARQETYASQDDKGQLPIAENQAARVAARRLAEDLMARLQEDF